MGRVAGSFGVHGWLKVVPYSAEVAALAAYPAWWLKGRDGAWRELTVEETKVHGAQLLAKLAGVADREAALALKGAALAVGREALGEPEQGRYYWSDLIGLDVVNGKGERLGTLRAMFSNGAHDVAEVVAERTRLLPWLPWVVKRVDLAARRAEVEWEADW
ncbi:MAG TPA: ribosome maturation factor RimM [Burkholderiales bacterium]|nr:ribosome maturation factor RimM [Burkholderiales bacterium]